MPRDKKEKRIKMETTPLSSYTLSEAHYLVTYLTELLLETNSSTVKISRDTLSEFLLAHLEFTIYVCYLTINSPDADEDDKDRLSQHRDDLRNIFFKVLLLSDMVEHNRRSPLTLPHVRSAELAAKIKAATGWDLPVDTDTYVPNAVLLAAYNTEVHSEDVSTKRKSKPSLPRIRGELASQVREELGWDYPITESEKRR